MEEVNRWHINWFFPGKLISIHEVFYVSILRRYRSDPSHVIQKPKIEVFKRKIGVSKVLYDKTGLDKYRICTGVERQARIHHELCLTGNDGRWLLHLGSSIYNTELPFIKDSYAVLTKTSEAIISQDVAFKSTLKSPNWWVWNGETQGAHRSFNLRN